MKMRRPGPWSVAAPLPTPHKRRLMLKVSWRSHNSHKVRVFMTFDVLPRIPRKGEADSGDLAHAISQSNLDLRVLRSGQPSPCTTAIQNAFIQYHKPNKTVPFTMEAINRRLNRRRQILFTITSFSELALRTSAYATQSSAHPCDTLSQAKMKMRMPYRKVPSQTASSNVRIPQGRYDLGLGRNPPVRGAPSNSKQQTIPHQVYEAVQFCNEHQAVMEYPSPQRNQQLRSEQDQRSAISATASTVSFCDRTAKATKNLPFVQPKRLSPDLIDIHASQVGCGQVNERDGRRSGRHPIATVTPHARKSSELELNTAWVEMLIHEQLQAMEGAVAQVA
jgi:hypothetical protein